MKTSAKRMPKFGVHFKNEKKVIYRSVSSNFAVTDDRTTAFTKVVEEAGNFVIALLHADRISALPDVRTLMNSFPYTREYLAGLTSSWFADVEGLKETKAENVRVRDVELGIASVKLSVAYAVLFEVDGFTTVYNFKANFSSPTNSFLLMRDKLMSEGMTEDQATDLIVKSV